MKLQQLRYVWEVARNGMNVSAAAQSLFTSQPGISKQILQLEEELGVQIFVRNGKHLSGLTPAGQRILEEAGAVLLRMDNIRAIAREFTDEKSGSLSIATTHTQSRYVLPAIISLALLVSLVWQLTRHDKAPTANWALTLAGGLYIGWGMGHLVALRGQLPNDVPADVAGTPRDQNGLDVVGHHGSVP